MADWRQIQARIRKAKTSSDPAAQLGELYERTRDAMVAFELAAWHEKAGNAAETVQWYTAAAQRFRRAQWRTKAEEALTRLGAPIPEPLPAMEQPAESVRLRTPEAVLPGALRRGSGPAGEAASDEFAPGLGLPYMNMTSPEPVDLLHEETQGETGSVEEGAAAAAPGSAAGLAAAKRRRRGRRGGRNRRGRGGAGQAVPAEGTQRNPSATADRRPAGPGVAGRFQPAPARPFDSAQGGQESEIEPAAIDHGHEPTALWQAGSVSIPTSDSVRHPSTELRASGGLVTSRSRAGDPGLSSRIAQLESQLRRLLACPLGSLEEADQAPAGPGVLLLSDSDQVTHYYIEACQTLRIGIGNLLRGGRGSKGASQLKPSMAEHLGISDSRVAKYLKDHCAVRWIQLDEGAPELAHFAMAVLRPVVRE